jgi:hypothetical protein
MAQEMNCPHEIADAIATTFAGVVEAGAGQKMIPELVSCLTDIGAVRT